MVGKREDILCPALKKNWGQGERVIIRPREWRGGGVQLERKQWEHCCPGVYKNKPD